MKYLVYNAYNVLKDIIMTNMHDVNSRRAVNNGRFVFPTLPTSLDDEYPRISIKLDSFEPEAVGAGNVVGYTETERVYGMKSALNFRLLIFVKKETEYPIDLNGASVRAKNELLVQELNRLLYLALFKAINEGSLSAEGFWINSIADIAIQPGSFEFDTSRIASEVSIKIYGIEHTTDLYNSDDGINDMNNVVEALMDSTC